MLSVLRVFVNNREIFSTEFDCLERKKCRKDSSGSRLGIRIDLSKFLRKKSNIIMIEFGNSGLKLCRMNAKILILGSFGEILSAEIIDVDGISLFDRPELGQTTNPRLGYQSYSVCFRKLYSLNIGE